MWTEALLVQSSLVLVKTVEENPSDCDKNMWHLCTGCTGCSFTKQKIPNKSCWSQAFLSKEEQMFQPRRLGATNRHCLYLVVSVIASCIGLVRGIKIEEWRWWRLDWWRTRQTTSFQTQPISHLRPTLLCTFLQNIHILIAQLSLCK